MSDTVVRFDGVGKMYKIFESRRDNLLDALGVDRIARRRHTRFSQFWALRGIDLDLRRGERLGIIGRNGAGKSTLLKLVTGNIPPTEGVVEVNGDVQALLEIGGGLHPEFTGRENASGALSLLGLSRREIDAAIEDIAEFTELGRFLDQPFKTYSQGMQARLSLAIATSTQPQILIVDEILGAGDAYFFAKSTARMQRLIEGGASVLLVSHSLDQVARFCARTIWIDRGRIVMQGPTQEVIKTYEKFIRELDDRRLQAKNRKSGGTFDAFEREGYTAALSARIHVPRGCACDVGVMEVLRDGSVEETIDVGGAQDADERHQSHLLLSSGGWGEVAREGHGRYFRRINPGGVGSATFYLWFFYPGSSYTIRVLYRADRPGAQIGVSRSGIAAGFTDLPASHGWRELEIPVAHAENDEDEERTPTSRSRWSGSGSLVIGDVRLVGADGTETATFGIGEPLTVTVDVVARQTGTFPLIPAALTFRADGVVVTRHVGERTLLDVREGDHISGRLDLGPLLLGDGVYLLSLGLYSKLDIDDIEPSEFYDYFDKSFEFRVTGNPRLHNELVRHPGRWSIEVDEKSTALAQETAP